MRTLRNVLFAVGLTAFGLSGLIADLVNVSWFPSPSTNVAGYNLYYGTNPAQYSQMITVGTNLNVTVSVAPFRPYFFAVTAYDNYGIESDYSEEAEYATVSWVYPTNSGNYHWVLETSTNLINWQLTTNPVVLNKPRAFFRLKGIPK